MKLKNVISSKQFDKELLIKLFDATDKIKSGKYDDKALTGKIMATLFYEPSTRTRLSFESAMLKLGGSTITSENAAEFSSAIKGEILEDTIRIVNIYSDVIVLRHSSNDSSEIAAKNSEVPIINAGSGSGEHPTQALMDMYTIWSKNRDKNVEITLLGDLKNGRTVHSLCYFLALFPNYKLNLVSPSALLLPEDIKKHLNDSGVSVVETENLDEVLETTDIIYQTRIQKERFVNHQEGKIDEEEYKKYFGMYIINTDTLDKMKKDSIILHPLPRINEITMEVDNDPRAKYFEQAKNGLYIRMALLLYLFDKEI